ncbi:flagellar hook-associated protein 2 [Alkalithermobacter thermoalcaliphilus JW-YL-7 = DSM 7308]|uniref:Flagellar hook-associated protein 2 n=1 Tax=Alkalithermobacter thermoalcaliphilus JW-YL-7 = DSM 7308 TaxID=1121328 RepID=A0A150FN67_CLOPD|nr:flagellar hook-associated 2 domain-containing protein [[Clostridium] paradoxum JW-YL-7 = DSM 7308]SHL06051.1 flagellar hook-associated protein 2 [[Clostridium] paradoxum JW-YL-7 = DSM 7308]
MRIGGLASGIDTEGLIKQLMDAERLRLNKFNQQKQIKVWTQERYNDINKSIANFILDTRRDFGISSLTSSTNNFTWIKRATSSDSSVLTATATTSAMNGTHTIRVKSLASGVNVASQEAIQDRGDNKTLSQLAEEIEGFTLSTDEEGNFTIKINGEDITLNSDFRMSDVVKAINDVSSKTKVRASYDANIGRLLLSTTNTGSEAKIEIDNDTRDVFNNLFKLNMENTEYKGTDAIIDFNGAENIAYSTNQFRINGINIDLRSANEDQEYTIRIDTDVDGVYEKIKSFVDKYNDLIDNLNKIVTEKRYRDYKPLLEEERKALDEETIKLWEEKAKSGLLRGDETINRILNSTRSGLYESVYSDGNNRLVGFSHLTEIGITTGNYQDRGKLTINEDRLKRAIQDDPDAVINLLFKTSNASDPSQKRKETGIINRIYDDLIDGMKGIINRSGTGDNASLYRNVRANILIDFVTKSSSISLIDRDIRNIDRQIDNENMRLSRIEESYWRRFTALEKAMAKMAEQSGWLMAQMGQMR